MIRSIIESSMRWRTVVVAVAALIMVIGISELDDITVDVFPEIAPPTVEVQTEALGLSAVEVEQLITVPLEADLLVGVPWLEVMRSESVPGLSSIQMTFQAGTDLMKARQVVQERLTGAHALPNVSKPPQMLQPLSFANRVMMIGVTSKDLSLMEMSVLARWTIQPRLMGVPGVAHVAIWGQRERQLQVQVDPARLKEHHVSLIQIIKTAGNALWLSPLSFLESSVAGTGGFIETPNQRLGLRHLLPISTAADLAKVPIEDAGLRLGEVATVIEDHQPLIGDAMTGQGPGLLFVVEKFPGANTLEVTDDVDEAIEALKPGLAGMQFDTSLYRPASYIQSAIDNVSKAVIVGLVLVAVALLALFYDWRAALIGLVSIPMSLLAAVLVIEATDSTFNAMSLAGLVIALGIVIDDAIINADIVLRRMRKETGGPIARSILETSLAARSPLVFATVIVLLAALPALLMEGVPGAFVRPMVVSYGLAVLASMVVALTISPALSLILLRRTPLERRPSPLGAWLQRRYDRLIQAFDGRTARRVRGLDRRRARLFDRVTAARRLHHAHFQRVGPAHPVGRPTRDVASGDEPNSRSRCPRIAACTGRPQRRRPCRPRHHGGSGGRHQLERAVGEHRSRGRSRQDRSCGRGNRSRLSRFRRRRPDILKFAIRRSARGGQRTDRRAPLRPRAGCPASRGGKDQAGNRRDRWDRRSAGRNGARRARRRDQSRSCGSPEIRHQAGRRAASRRHPCGRHRSRQSVRGTEDIPGRRVGHAAGAQRPRRDPQSLDRRARRLTRAFG